MHRIISTAKCLAFLQVKHTFHSQLTRRLGLFFFMVEGPVPTEAVINSYVWTSYGLQTRISRKCNSARTCKSIDHANSTTLTAWLTARAIPSNYMAGVERGKETWMRKRCLKLQIIQVSILNCTTGQTTIYRDRQQLSYNQCVKLRRYALLL